MPRSATAKPFLSLYLAVDKKQTCLLSFRPLTPKHYEFNQAIAPGLYAIHHKPIDIVKLQSDRDCLDELQVQVRHVSLLARSQARPLHHPSPMRIVCQ